MFSQKKLSLFLSFTLLAAPQSAPLFSQSSNLADVSQSSSEGITFGTMYTAFQKDLTFEEGVQLVVDAAVSLFRSTIEESDRLKMNHRIFLEPVVGGIEESILTRSKDVGLQKREQDILYNAVMGALRKEIAQLGLQVEPAPPPPPPPPPSNPAVTQVTPEVPDEPPTAATPEPPAESKKKPGIKIPGGGILNQPVSGYYLSTFVNVGGADAGPFNNNAQALKINPGTAWGYGLAIGVERADNTRIELEASWRGSSADAPAGVAASDLDISYYSLMVNAYKDFEIAPVNNLDAFIGFGLGVSIANLSGDVNYNPTRPGTTFGGHIPETGEAALAYQLIVGAAYRYSTDMSLIMAYRLFNTENFNHYNPDPVHMFEIGIRKDL